MLQNRFDHANKKLSTFIYAGPLGPTLFPSLVSINTWQTNTPIQNGRGCINWLRKVIFIHHQAYRDHQQHDLYNDDLSKGQGEKEKRRRSTTVLVKIVQPLLSLLIRINVGIKCSTCSQLYIEMKYNPSNMSSAIQVSTFFCLKEGFTDSPCLKTISAKPDCLAKRCSLLHSARWLVDRIWTSPSIRDHFVNVDISTARAQILKYVKQITDKYQQLQLTHPLFARLTVPRFTCKSPELR